MGFTAGTNLLAEWQPDNNYWFSPSDWSGGLDPGFDGDIHSGLNFTIPANTTAEVCLPTANGYEVKTFGSGKYHLNSTL